MLFWNYFRYEFGQTVLSYDPLDWEDKEVGPWDPSTPLSSRAKLAFCLAKNLLFLVRKLQNESSPNFRILPRIFWGVFVLRFVGNGDQIKFTKDPCHFLMQNSRANIRKNVHKHFLESRHREKVSLEEVPRRTLSLFKSPSGGGLTKMGSVTVSNILRSIGHFFFVRSNCWGPGNQCVWAPKPCIVRSFGLKMRQKQKRKVCQTCFCAIIAVCRRDF